MKMLYAGEDIKFISRRIMICAAEDVGLADTVGFGGSIGGGFRLLKELGCRKHRSYWQKR